MRLSTLGILASGCLAIGAIAFWQSSWLRASLEATGPTRLLSYSYYAVRYAYIQPGSGQSREIFLSRCASCHGPDGAGRSGPPLARERISPSPSVRALYDLISGGIPGTEMPAFRLQLGAREMWMVAGYVWNLQPPESKVSGDPARGETIFRGKGRCLSCHPVGSGGANAGPDLTGIGSRRGVDSLRESLLSPAASISPDYMVLSLTLLDGEKVRGTLLKEDTFSMQLIDSSGHFHSLWKTEIRDDEHEEPASPMPSYANTLSSGELEDLLAYLVSLGAAR